MRCQEKRQGDRTAGPKLAFRTGGSVRSTD